MRKSSILLLIGMTALTGCGDVQSVTPQQIEESAEVTPETSKGVTKIPKVRLDIQLKEDPMKDPYGVAINSQGHLYVSDMGNNRILIFDDKGALLDQWAKSGSGEGEFKTMGFGGVAIDSEDNVYVVDNDNFRIQKFDKKGKYLAQWGTEGTGEGQFVRAIGIAVDSENNVYVTDDGNPYVQKFDNTGKFLMRFGGEGDGEGTFRHATGIAVDDLGQIFVADYETKLVQKFDAQGKYVLSWQMGEDIGVIGTPEGIAIDDEGQVYVTDYDLGRLQVFDNAGVLLWAMGGDVTETKLFLRPTAVTIDPNGNLVIVNQSGAKLTVIEKP